MNGDFRHQEFGSSVRGLRWWMISLVFLATLINFIDRLVITAGQEIKNQSN